MTWLPFASALVLIGTAPASVPTAPVPEPPTAEELDLAAERHQRMTVPVTIMGKGPFRFIVDTGAQATLIASVLADRLELGGREQATLIALNSSRPVETALIPEFSLGSRTFPIRSAALVEQGNIDGADGILGLDGLQHTRVLIDFTEGRIMVADAGEQARSGYEIIVRARHKLGQLIITSAEVDGVRTQVIIDTGAQSSIGNLALERRLRKMHPLGSGRMTDVNGIARAGQFKVVRSLEIDRMRLENVPVVFTDSPSFTALGLDDKPAMLLGMTELRAFERVAIDFSRREVLFDLPHRAADWPSPGRGASRL